MSKWLSVSVPLSSGRVCVSARDRAYFFHQHLQTMPVALAYWRCFESERYAREQFPAPVLDIGCGDGMFVRTVFERPLDVGIDLDPEEIRLAASGGWYRETFCADVTNLPLEAGRFQSVISNCVLEHVQQIDRALAEISRVMAPGGRLFFTVPSEHYSRSFFWDEILRKLGMPRLAKRYVDGINGMFRHYNLNDQATWAKRLCAAGLELERAEKFISRAALRQHERWFPIGLPSKLWKRLLRRRVLLPRFFIRWFAPWWFKKSMWTEDANGVCYLIVARKP